MNKSIFLPIAAISLLVSAASATADGLRFELAELVRRADLVATAVAIEVVETQNSDGLPHRTAVFEIDTALKGDVVGRIEVNLDSSVPARRIECCEAGAKYVVYVRQISPRRWTGVNGSYSVVRVFE